MGELLPFVATGREDPGAGELAVAFGFERVMEEGKFDGFAVADGGFGAKVEVVGGVAIAASPTAVGPGAHNEGVVGGRRILLHEGAGAEGALGVFGVKPAADGVDGFEVPPDAASFLIVVVGGVADVFEPVGVRVFEVFFVGVTEPAHAEVEIVAVGGFELEGGEAAGGVAFAFDEALVEAEVGGEDEGAVVIGVVAEVVVGDGSLGEAARRAGWGCPTCRLCQCCF